MQVGVYAAEARQWTSPSKIAEATGCPHSPAAVVITGTTIGLPAGALCPVLILPSQMSNLSTTSKGEKNTQMSSTLRT